MFILIRVFQDRDGISSYCVMHGGLVLVYENRYPSQGYVRRFHFPQSLLVDWRGEAFTFILVYVGFNWWLTALSPGTL